MNIFIAGTSSILAAQLVESFFRQKATLFLCDELPRDDGAISAALEATTAGQAMDVVMILYGDDVFYGDLKKFRRGKPATAHRRTEAICRFFAGRTKKPETLMLTSSVNIYGSASQHTADESTPSGNDFVAHYFKELEAATRAAEDNGIRVVHMRLGTIVCRSSKPALPRLPWLPASIHAICSDVNSRTSWISAEDALAAVLFLLENEELSSPVNITSGDFPSRKDLFSTVKKHYGIGLMLLVPSALLQCILGRHRASLYCRSTMAMPTKLLQAGFFTQNISLHEYLGSAHE
ncbi:MAG: hypothetical protein ABR512_15405 [Desulfopila sp.]